jgi:vacuolar iron transporter family protein
VLHRRPTGPVPDAGMEGSDVVGSGLGAAIASFAMFATGAFVPVIPFLLGLREWTAVVVAGILTGIALMIAGATVGVLSGAPPLRRALRQLAIGATAATVTWLLGLAFSTIVG